MSCRRSYPLSSRTLIPYLTNCASTSSTGRRWKIFLMWLSGSNLATKLCSPHLMSRWLCICSRIAIKKYKVARSSNVAGLCPWKHLCSRHSPTFSKSWSGLCSLNFWTKSLKSDLDSLWGRQTNRNVSECKTESRRSLSWCLTRAQLS